MAVRFLLFISFSFIYLFSALANAETTASINTQSNSSIMPQSFQQCIACHGKNAQGSEVLKAPILAAQYSGYLQRQLNYFANGLRGDHPQDTQGQQMAAIAKNLNSSEIILLANYIAALPAITIYDDKRTGDLKNGSRYYQAKCGACHGGIAQGNEAFNAPKLAQQSYTYLAKQMSNFQQGVRGTKKQDKYGRQMAMMAKTVSAKELNDILFFITQQKTIAKSQ